MCSGHKLFSRNVSFWRKGDECPETTASLHVVLPSLELLEVRIPPARVRGLSPQPGPCFVLKGLQLPVLFKEEEL